MRTLLIKTFVKDYENTKDPAVRESYGKLAGIVGILSNLLLCILKIGIGLIFKSIAILADGINNLADASSSIITLVGFRLASKPADEDHPYGHARIEYITGLIVSLVIIFLGFQLFMSSVDKIRNPEPLEFSILTVAVLILAILIKVWQALFNIKIGTLIHSATLKATGADSRNDVIATSAVLISLLVEKLTNLQLDGWMGAVVALFIIYSGIQLVKETSAPLLGQAPDPELVKSIHDRAVEFKGVLGIHDLIVHDYGPGRIFASIHVEVDADGDILASHDMIDNIERVLSRDLKIHLIVHMDPIDTKDPVLRRMKEDLQKIVDEMEDVQNFHDLRVVPGYSHTNFIFDIVISPECIKKETDLCKYIQGKVAEIDPKYCCVITVDHAYTKPQE
ncbi:MAG: cation diffusion facilitator family transporter [Anaerovoracaceae bacterium]|nr:cation diffusion facilitator family transporter [Anaerovoracaceae bacterium]